MAGRVYERGKCFGCIKAKFLRESIGSILLFSRLFSGVYPLFFILGRGSLCFLVGLLSKSIRQHRTLRFRGGSDAPQPVRLVHLPIAAVLLRFFIFFIFSLFFFFPIFVLSRACSDVSYKNETVVHLSCLIPNTNFIRTWRLLL